MDYPTLEAFFSTSPVAKLFRRDWPAMIVAFLHQTFIATPRISLPESQLVALLGGYLEDLTALGKGPFGEPAKLVEDWCRDEFGILEKYFDSEGEVVCQMTGNAHKVVAWIQNLTTVQFVATDSKMKSLWRDLNAVIDRATSNPDDRLLQIERQAEQLQAEATQIRATGQMEVMTPAQLNADFSRLITLVREIPGDFRTVEEKLQQVAANITARMMEEDANRGEIVRIALDSDEELRRSDQGQSFAGFWEFLMAPGQREEFETLIDTLYRIPALSDQNRTNPVLRHLFSVLMREGEKVIRSQQRISGQLRRAMDISVRIHRRAVAEAIREIKRTAHLRREEFAGDRAFCGIFDDPDTDSFMTRPLFEPAEKADLTVDLQVASPLMDPTLLKEFANMRPIRLELLRANLRTLIATRGGLVTLEEVFERYPPVNGLIEVMAYISIVTESRENYISEDTTTLVAIPGLPTNLRLRVPEMAIQTVRPES
jgi:hypothetical protein